MFVVFQTPEKTIFLQNGDLKNVFVDDRQMDQVWRAKLYSSVNPHITRLKTNFIHSFNPNLHRMKKIALPRRKILPRSPSVDPSLGFLREG